VDVNVDMANAIAHPWPPFPHGHYGSLAS